MENLILASEQTIHANLYFGTLMVAMLLELLIPLRAGGFPLRSRWIGNFLLTVVNLAIDRLVMPIAGLALAYLALERGWGLFNVIEVPLLVNIVVTILVMDLVNYTQHRLLHGVPWLWRVHKVHHSDPDVDITTTIRFHPLESVFSTAVNFIPVIVFGFAPVAYFIYAMLLVILGFISHSNFRIPGRLEQVAGLLFVTPYLHRIHHSSHQPATDSNFGSAFSFWDRILGTFTPSRAMDQQTMELGLSEYRDKKYLQVHWLLAMPFIKDPASASAPQPLAGESRQATL